MRYSVRSSTRSVFATATERAADVCVLTSRHRWLRSLEGLWANTAAETGEQLKSRLLGFQCTRLGTLTTNARDTERLMYTGAAHVQPAVGVNAETNQGSQTQAGSRA